MPSNKVLSIKEDLKEKIMQSEDAVFKELHTKEKYIEALYIKTNSDETVIQDYVVKPFFENATAERFLNYLQSHPKVKPFENKEQTLEELIRGVAVLFYQDFIFLF
ncbi:spore germination protein [Neobacillus bataviensis]|uniref:spore germination protein n=1 Tax=Neobacillus bataviensis TaxID=220685 RepID=UPI001CBFBC64|nr:spore germination protein [Neobacillus bataviensis]